ncbi:F-box domain-containing protein [Mycena chlorophos]|uniref:F-box domain-containing protein n=1 Tax=Mycena chlorophos TaxID=658473 RepID=A0A8H6S7C3_MYCCL|nr:F-box domain-containing protein [Mycena chlorophos]
MSTAAFNILSLPIEITTEIFFHALPSERTLTLLPLDAPLVFLAVCKTWNQIAESTPTLWRFLRLYISPPDFRKADDATFLAGLERWFLCCGERLGLLFKLSGSVDCIAWILRSETFRSHASSISSLELTPINHASEAATIELPELSNLRAFEWVKLPYDHGRGGPVSLAVGPHYPQLRWAFIRYAIPSELALPWQQLTEFHCRLSTVSQVLEFIRLLPNVVRFESLMMSNSKEQRTLDAKHEVVHSTLQHLRIEHYYTPSPTKRAALEFITAPNLKSLRTDVPRSTFTTFLQRSRFPSLTYLDLDVCNEPREWDFHVDGFISQLTSLVELHLRDLAVCTSNSLFRHLPEESFLPNLRTLAVKCRREAGDEARDRDPASLLLEESAEPCPFSAILLLAGSAVANRLGLQVAHLGSLQLLERVPEDASLDVVIPDEVQEVYKNLRDLGVRVHIRLTTDVDFEVEY